jgi:hypothetical protein
MHCQDFGQTLTYIALHETVRPSLLLPTGTHAYQRPAAPAALLSSRATTVIPQAAAAPDVTQQKGRARLHQQPQELTQQQQPQKQRRPAGEGRPPAPLTSKPYLVRIAGRTSSIQGAAGAITKRLRTDVSACPVAPNRNTAVDRIQQITQRDGRGAATCHSDSCNWTPCSSVGLLWHLN